MEELLKLLLAVGPMSKGLIRHLESIIECFEFKPDDIIVDFGRIADLIFFIKRGLIRSYYLLDGREVTNWFMKEENICIEVLSFLEGTPSENRLVALEACECYGIRRAQLEETYLRYPQFERHGRIITSQYYCESERRNIASKRQTPERKLELLLATAPDLIKRVSKEVMASYAGVSDRTWRAARKAYEEKHPSDGKVK